MQQPYRFSCELGKHVIVKRKWYQFWKQKKYRTTIWTTFTIAIEEELADHIMTLDHKAVRDWVHKLVKDDYLYPPEVRRASLTKLT